MAHAILYYSGYTIAELVPSTSGPTKRNGGGVPFIQIFGFPVPFGSVRVEIEVEPTIPEAVTIPFTQKIQIFVMLKSV